MDDWVEGEVMSNRVVRFFGAVRRCILRMNWILLNKPWIPADKPLNWRDFLR